MRELMEAVESFKLSLERIKEAERDGDETSPAYQYYKDYYDNAEEELRAVFRSVILEVLADLVMGKNPAAALAALAKPSTPGPGPSEPDDGEIRATLHLARPASNRLNLS